MAQADQVLDAQLARLLEIEVDERYRDWLRGHPQANRRDCQLLDHPEALVVDSHFHEDDAIDHFAAHYLVDIGALAGYKHDVPAVPAGRVDHPVDVGHKHGFGEPVIERDNECNDIGLSPS